MVCCQQRTIMAEPEPTCNSRSNATSHNALLLSLGHACYLKQHTSYCTCIATLHRLLAVAGSGDTGTSIQAVLQQQPRQQQQCILVYDLLRHAGSAVSGATLCLQDSSRVVTLEARPWDSHALYWRVLPCHGGKAWPLFGVAHLWVHKDKVPSVCCCAVRMASSQCSRCTSACFLCDVQWKLAIYTAMCFAEL